MAPLTGGSPTVFASAQHSAWGIAIDSATVDWTTLGTSARGRNDGTDGAVKKLTPK